jgi:hypothetical protein
MSKKRFIFVLSFQFLVQCVAESGNQIVDKIVELVELLFFILLNNSLLNLS